jgi:hypothetical protein
VQVDELGRIRGLLELYEVALQEIRRLGDPGLDELEARLEARASVAAHDYYELLQAAATLASPAGAWPSRRR